MIGGLRREKVAIARNRILAAIVGLRGWGAFPFKAAIHCIAVAQAASKTVERPNKQYHCQKADDEMDALFHSTLNRLSLIWNGPALAC